MYPNPFNQELTVRFDASSEGSEATINLYDVQGRKVYSHNVKTQVGENEVSLEAVSIQPGVYIVECTNDGRSFRKRVVKD